MAPPGEQLTAVVPGERAGELEKIDFQEGLVARIHLTKPKDKDNELIKVAAVHGPPGILAVLRSRRDYAWFVVLCLRAIDACVGEDRSSEQDSLKELQDCDPIAFRMQMYELEMIDEIFQIMKHYEHLKEVQKLGLCIIEKLTSDDPEWRDEIARKGGVSLICGISKKFKDVPNLMEKVLTVMSYLAAEDYIEVMLCQHDALEYVTHVMKTQKKNAGLMFRASLALLNLTVCEPHVEEMMDKEAILPVLEVMDVHYNDVTLIMTLCGVLANFSVKEGVRQILVQNEVLPRIKDAMKLEPENPHLQVACLKALVNYSTNAEHYIMMEELDIPAMVGQTMVDLCHDADVQKYGNYFLGQHTSCPLM